MTRAHAAARPPRRTVATWIRSQFDLTTRTIDGWNDLTRRMKPPDEALGRLVENHPEMRAGSEGLVWAGFQQWVRLRGRSTPGLCQPSLVVDELWSLLSQDRSAWTALPDQVRAMDRVAVRGHRARDGLSETHGCALADEGSVRLPLLFSVDEVARVEDGRLYQAECTTAHCSIRSVEGDDPQPGRTCLHQAPWLVADVTAFPFDQP